MAPTKWRPEHGRHKPWPRRRKPRPPKATLPEQVLTTFTDRQGRARYRRMKRSVALMRMAQRKGAEALHAAGKAHRWTSEEAAKARRKGARKRYGRFNRRIGVRLGGRLRNRPRLNRALLRAYYTDHTTKGVWYAGLIDGKHVWMYRNDTQQPPVERRISEVAALVRLGYKPSKKAYIPERILPARSSHGHEAS